MLFEVALSYSGTHDKRRDAELSRAADLGADQDAEIERRVDDLTEALSPDVPVIQEPSPTNETVHHGMTISSIEQSTSVERPLAGSYELPGPIAASLQMPEEDTRRAGGDSLKPNPSQDSRRLKIIAAAETYRARGWPIVRLVGKAAVDTGWVKATASSPMPNFGDANNIGIFSATRLPVWSVRTSNGYHRTSLLRCSRKMSRALAGMARRGLACF